METFSYAPLSCIFGSIGLSLAINIFFILHKKNLIKSAYLLIVKAVRRWQGPRHYRIVIYSELHFNVQCFFLGFFFAKKNKIYLQIPNVFHWRQYLVDMQNAYA